MADEDFKPGHYQVQVHIIEARDIKADSPSPKVVVDVMGKKKSTPTMKGSFSPVYDHLLFWELPNLTLDHFEYGKINVSLFDTNTTLRANIVGSFEFDLMYVHNQKNHELYRNWVALTDPTDEKEGVQALVKISVTVLGPGEDPYVHDEQEEDDEGDAAIVMPPRMKTEDHLLFLQFHKATNLPAVDSSLMSSEKGGIDPYFKVLFAGVEGKTSTIKSDKNPTFSDEVRMPVTFPAMTDRIKIVLMDFDTVGTDDVIATTQLRLSDVPHLEDKDVSPGLEGGGFETPAGALTKWVNLYGPLGKSESASAMKMRKGLCEGSGWLGRVLVSAWHMTVEGPKQEKRDINTIPGPQDEPYTIRGNILQGASLPFDSELSVCLSFGGNAISTRKKKGKHGATQWSEELDELEANINASSPPDVFLYLMKGDTTLAYIRHSLDHVMNKMSLNLPVWSSFEEDIVSAGIPSEKVAGELLYELSGGPTSQLDERPSLVRPSFMPCTLLCYLYQGKDLPALDASEGHMDPYVVVSFSGTRIRFPTIYNTRFPVWNKLMPLKADVIQPFELAPSIHVTVADWDDTSSDDLAGRFSVDISKVTAQKQEPVWYNLMLDGLPVPGSILCSFQLVPMTEKVDIPKTIAPSGFERLVEFTVIGLRNLAPYGLLRISKPFCKVTLGGDTKQTIKSCKPSGTNPNILECLSFKLPLPSDSLYAPCLVITVHDDRTISTPRIAQCSIPLAPYYTLGARKTTAFFKRDNVGDLKGGDAVVPEGEDFARSAQPPDQQEQDETEGLLGGEIELSDMTPRESANPQEEDPDSDGESDTEEFMDASAKYMEGRKSLKCELEDTLKLKPFEEFPLLRTRTTTSGPPKNVGVLKGNVFVLPPNADENMERPFSHTELSRPKHYVVRVYIIRGINLTSKDENGFSDPVLEIDLGRKNIFDKESLRKATINPEFHSFYELDAVLPGQSHLTVSVWDSDMSGYELIGKTVIDLENYFFSEEWHSYDKKPLEKRTLWSELTPSAQGVLEMWVDVLDPRLASVVPPIDISPPPKIPFEIRVIVWKAKNVRAGDYIGNLTDMYVRCEVTGNRETQKKDTDIHWRADRGKGSFNYRMVFDVELPMKKPRISFQVWDQDIIGGNDALGECTIGTSTFQRCLVAAYRTQTSSFLRLKKNEDNAEAKSIWLTMRHPEEGDSGEVLVEVEVLPKSVSQRKPAGEGRSTPNSNPYLPPPIRMEWNLLRPDLILKKLIGPDLFASLKLGMCCIVCCMILGFLLYFVGQLASIIAVFT